MEAGSDPEVVDAVLSGLTPETYDRVVQGMNVSVLEPAAGSAGAACVRRLLDHDLVHYARGLRPVLHGAAGAAVGRLVLERLAGAAHGEPDFERHDGHLRTFLAVGSNVSSNAGSGSGLNVGCGSGLNCGSNAGSGSGLNAGVDTGSDSGSDSGPGLNGGLNCGEGGERLGPLDLSGGWGSQVLAGGSDDEDEELVRAWHAVTVPNHLWDVSIYRKPVV